LKRQWAVAGIVLILGASLLVELYVNRQYPEKLIEITFPENQVGKEHFFRFYREGELVGTHSYIIKSQEEGVSSTTYIMNSSTDINYEGKSLILKGQYFFNHLYRPIFYTLNVTEENKHTQLLATFSQDLVEVTIESNGDIMELTESVSEGALLIENQMPGYWEVLFQSSALIPNERYVVDAFIPQRVVMMRLTLKVDSGTSKVRHNGVELDCTVVRESNLDLVFYLFNGELIQYRDDVNGVYIVKMSIEAS
jgi:hypothetical protein